MSAASPAESLLAPTEAGVIPSGDRPDHLQAPVFVRAAEPLTVTVDLADAIGVGLSILALINAKRIPSCSVDPFKRIAEQLVAAARAAAVGVGQ